MYMTLQMEENYKMLAKTLFGFEDILAKELTQLGAMQVEKGVRNVSFVGDKGLESQKKMIFIKM